MAEDLILKITQLSNLGLGIARHENQVIFAKNTCPGDIVRVKNIEKKHNYSVADVEIITASQFRVEPVCPLQKICGSCQIQFIDYDFQLKLKKRLIEDVMHSIYASQGIPDIPIRDVVPSPKIWGARRKIQFAVRQSGKSGLKIGYYKEKTHDIVNIKHCPMIPEACVDIIDYMRECAQRFGIRGYNESDQTGALRHVVMRSSSIDDQILLTLVINSRDKSHGIVNFARDIYKKFQSVLSGVSLNYNTGSSNLILSDKTECVIGEPCIYEELCGVRFKIETNTFFQVNPESANNLFRFVKSYIRDNFNLPTILDAYAGISAFGFVLSDIASSVVCVEECEDSVRLAREVRDINRIMNVSVNHSDASKFFQRLQLIEHKKFEVVILDPPRKGCSEESLRYASALSNSTIIYVSCNPATLARDLKYLVTKMGGRVRFIQPFDMFFSSYHVECVAVVEK